MKRLYCNRPLPFQSTLHCACRGRLTLLLEVLLFLLPFGRPRGRLGVGAPLGSYKSTEKGR